MSLLFKPFCVPLKSNLQHPGVVTTACPFPPQTGQFHPYLLQIGVTRCCSGWNSLSYTNKERMPCLRALTTLERTVLFLYSSQPLLGQAETSQSLFSVRFLPPFSKGKYSLVNSEVGSSGDSFGSLPLSSNDWATDKPWLAGWPLFVPVPSPENWSAS